jgi:hypothetical protein
MRRQGHWTTCIECVSGKRLLFYRFRYNICLSIYIDRRIYGFIPGDLARLRVLLLSREVNCVCELTQASGEIQAKISRHLALLR